MSQAPPEESSLETQVEEDAEVSDEQEDESDGVTIRQRLVDVAYLFETFLEDDDPQTLHMTLFRVAEIVLNRAPGRQTQELLKMLTKAGDSASRARLELDPDLAAQHEHRFEARKVRAYNLAASIQEI